MNILLAALVFAVTSRLGYAAPASNYMGIFKTSSFLALEWSISDSTFESYNAEELFSIELAASKYFNGLLSDRGLSAFQNPNEFVDVAISVRRQVLTGINVIIETTLDLYHIGNSGIADLSDLLRFVTNKNTTGSEDFLALDALLGMNIKVAMVSFANSKASYALAGGFDPYYLGKGKQGEESRHYTEGEKTLIVVVSVLSFALFVLSIILIWIAGGWLVLRRQVQILIHREEEMTRITQGIEQKPTQDTEDDASPYKDDASNFTNPSGILGVNPYYGRSSKIFEGLGVKMTPKRSRSSDVDSDIATPMSEYSDSGRMPIGITSMRKILANRNNQENIPSAEPFGMKRLDYDN